MVGVVAVVTDTADAIESLLRLHSEKLDVTIKPVVTGRVEVSTVTHSREFVIDEALTSQHAEIEHVAIGRIVDTAPEMREEDGVFIIPIIEEIVVVERRLFLKEEVRIRRSTRTHRHHEIVTLREQEAVVTRTPSAQGPDAVHPDGAAMTPEEILP